MSASTGNNNRFPIPPPLPGTSNGNSQNDGKNDYSKYYALINGHKAHPTHLLAKFKRQVAQTNAWDDAVKTFNLKVTSTFPLLPGMAVLGSSKDAGQVATDVKDAEKRGVALMEQAKTMMASGQFEYVEPDYLVYLSLEPTDSGFSEGKLWGLRNAGQEGGVAGIDIGATQAWDITTGDTNIIVAVIDSGIRYTHQDLAAQMWHNPSEVEGNGIDDDLDGYIDDVFGVNLITGSGDPFDDNGHGTHVAGTIGASANGGGGHVGVAWNVRLIACKSFDANGVGLTSDEIKGINFAMAKHARLINASWSSSADSQALSDAIARCGDAGILFIAAAGNDGRDTDETPKYPSSYPLENIISVAAIDRRGELASFSNFGRKTVDLAAPGVSIFSCFNSSDTSYASLDGTSMATPHVTGVAALIWAAFPGIGPLDVKDRLMQGSIPLPALADHTVSGGRVDAYASLSLRFEGPPIFLSQQGDSSVSEGGSAIFFANANGVRPLSFQWFHNGEILTGATNRSLALDEVSATDAGRYSVMASNSVGTAASINFMFTVLPPPPISTYAGRLGQPGDNTGVKKSARFSYPEAVALDSTGNLYVADTGNSTIRKISPAQLATTLAGAAGQKGSSDGILDAARFANPEGIAIDHDGNIYVADTGNATIRKITANGTVSTLAGAAGAIGSDDGFGGGARFNAPEAVAVDATGNVYVADSGNHTIRKLAANGMVTTLAGLAGNAGFADGNGGVARFSSPSGIAVDPLGNVYVADEKNSAIRKVTQEGAVITLAGTRGSRGSEDGPGRVARFAFPEGVAVDLEGNVWVGDTLNHAVRRISSLGVVSTIAGKPGVPGNVDGSWSDAVFNLPKGMAIAPGGNIYLADYGNSAIRKITPVPSAPAILREPQGFVVRAGESATLSVAASGSGILNYQWRKNGIDIADATGPSLEFPSVTQDNTGIYTVEVSNAEGHVISQPAELRVLLYTPPSIIAISPPG